MINLRYSVLILMLFTLIALPQNIDGVARTIANPQASMVGSRVSTLGVTNPAVIGDISATMINPATLGGVESMPIAFTTEKVLNIFNYTLINVGYPMEIRIPLKNNRTHLQRIAFGLSYGSVTLDEIPRTVLDQSEVFEIDQFSSGFNVIQAAVGTSFYNVIPQIDVASLGLSGKVVRHFVDDESHSTVGLDLGGILTHNIDYGILNRVHFGGSIHNFLAPSIKWDETGNEAKLPFEVYLGGRVDLYDDRLTIYANNGIHGLNISAESLFIPNIILRGSTDFNLVSLGTGIIFDEISGAIGAQNYSVRLDYHYQQNVGAFSEDPTHAISVSVLGRSQPSSPRILNPTKEVIITKKSRIRTNGIGPKNTTMRVYVNDNLTRTTVSTRYGKWAVEGVPLKEGKNEIIVRAFQLEKDQSQHSNTVTIFSDTKPPKLDIQVLPEKEQLTVVVKSNENLKNLTGKIGEIVLGFTQKNSPPPSRDFQYTPMVPTEWEAKIPMPVTLQEGARVQSQMSILQVSGQDDAGNKTQSDDFPFFISMSYPKDKHVHYKEDLRFIGNASTMVKTVSINGNPIYIDPNYQFSIPIALKPGKNNVKVSLRTLNDINLTYTMRVLRLVTFPDLNERVRGRQEIDFLATLGVLEGNDDGNFYPTEPVTRQYIAKLLVLASDEAVIEDVENNLFADVRSTHPFAQYIQAAIQAGLMFAYPDGTFKPEDTLSLSEIIFLLSNAGIIDYQQVEEEGTEVITRAQLAEFLAYTPSYELKIERLKKWEVGYND